MLSEKNKKLLINIGILSGTFLAVTAVLVLMIFASRGFWSDGLKDIAKETIEKYEPKTWAVGKQLKFDSPLNTSSAVYKCKNSKTGQNACAVVIRITTICGSVPAVFICTENDSTFAGYGINMGKAEKILSKDTVTGSILYWQTSLPQILKKAGVQND